MAMPNIRFGYSVKKNSGARYWLYSVFEYYSNNILFVFVFGHNSEPEYYSYSYSAKYLCTNIIRIRIRSFWKNEYYSYSYSVQNLIPNIICIRIQSIKQYSLTSDFDADINWHFGNHTFYCPRDRKIMKTKINLRHPNDTPLVFHLQR